VTLEGAASPCPLCDSLGGLLVARQALWRVVRVDDATTVAQHPAFWRLIWNTHVAEFTDLPRAERIACMDAVATLERTVRHQLKPTKMNVASLGNVVPHLHWHVVARFAEDSHYPAPVWASPQRPTDAAAVQALQRRLAGVDDALREALA
jgi:diadenosine tetraphosphate (Ap4A) HIT family hydrolase